MKKLALTFAAAAALVASASQAAVPAYPDNPDVLWRGDFEDGVTSLTGHCSYGDNGWCKEQSVRSQQIQIVASVHRPSRSRCAHTAQSASKDEQASGR